jgi:thymidylate kinase
MRASTPETDDGGETGVGELVGLIQAQAAETLRARAEMLVAALRALDRAGIAWCVVSGRALAMRVDGSSEEGRDGSAAGGAALRVALDQCRLDPDDVDMVVLPQQWAMVPRALAALPGVAIVRAQAYAATSTRYDLASFPGDGAPVFLALDVSSEVRAFGTVLMSAHEFLTARRRLGPLLWTPRPSVQFIFSLLKQLHKMRRLGDDAVSTVPVARLSPLYRADPLGCRRQLDRFFPDAVAARIARAAEQGAWEWVLERRLALGAELMRLRARRHPLGVLRYRLGEGARAFRRIMHPTGLMVVFLGLDGSGKSTVVARVLRDLGAVFPSGRRYHQRPCVLWAGAEDRTVRGPRPMPRRGWVGSLVKLALWAADYWAGFLWEIFPRLVQSALVSFDRYYYDLLADPDRYRYGGPLPAARLLAHALPRPDLVILLDAPPEVSDARRRDGQFRSASRLRPAYTALVHRLRAGHVVDASRPIEEVVAEVERVILRFLGQRTVRRLGGRA